MNEDAVTNTLTFFSKKVSVKGRDTLEKLSGLVQRWEKVIEDCEKSSDQSQYRLHFKEAHKVPAGILRRYLGNGEPKTEEELIKLISSLSNRLIFNLRQEKEESGSADALSYIIVELQSCQIK